MRQQTEEALAVYQSTPWLQTLWEHWQHGECEALRAWDLPELELHPQRGWALALIAMAYQEIGSWECARKKLQQAEQWGVPIDQIFSLLINTPKPELNRQNVAVSVTNPIFTLETIVNQKKKGIDYFSAFDISKKDDSSVYYHIETGKGGYLLSNETADFNKVPQNKNLELEPNKAYELSGFIDCDSEEAPIVWFFEYNDHKKLTSKSVSTKNGVFSCLLKTDANHLSAALGIRIAGSGRLHWKNCQIRLNSDEKVQQKSEFQELWKGLVDNLEKKLVNTQKKISTNFLFQTESFIRLQGYLGQDTMLPDMHNWLISPDLGVLLIRLVEATLYDAVIEFGSGVSTLILAKALQKTHSKRAATAHSIPAPFLSFEHLAQYHAQTAQHLQQAGLTEAVDLRLAPLKPYQGPDGNTYSYYDATTALQQLTAQLPADRPPKVLILIDGPPAATGLHARYPALPVLLATLGPHAHYHMLMDDYIRDDERAIVTAWQALLADQGLTTRTDTYNKLEKQACLLSIGDWT